MLPVILLGAQCALSLKAQSLAKPAMEISVPLNKDTRSWTLADTLTNGPVGSVVVFTSEWVPKGDSIDAWKEMFDKKAVITKDTVRHQIDIWKAMLAQVDPKAEVNEEKNADGSIIVTYTSVSADEMGMQRYLQGDDGIYILSYRARPSSKNEARWKLWRDIISAATLISSHTGIKAANEATLHGSEDEDLAKLQGNWTMAYMEIRGQKCSDTILKTYTLAIKGNHWWLTQIVKSADGSSKEQLNITTFRIYPSENPKMIDLIRPEKDRAFISQGIYKLEGDTLTICRTSEKGEERPKEFKTTESAGILVIWKRTHEEPQPDKSPEPAPNMVSVPHSQLTVLAV